MKCLILFMLIATAFSILTEEQSTSLFDNWMKQHGISYENIDLKVYRYGIFKDNLNMIVEHNQKKLPWTMEMNRFGDLTAQEFKEKYLCDNIEEHLPTPSSRFIPPPTIQAPNKFDWTDKPGVVQPVKDQGACGSCWAFSAIACTEGMMALFQSKSLSLSEQQLVDCSGSYGNHGCAGGWPSKGFQYIIDHGICLEKDYPYTHVTGTCHDTECTAAAHASSFTDCDKNEAALQTMLLKQPVSVAVDANSWQFYSSGVLTQCGESIDHAVTLTGYYNKADDNDLPYWRIKNSWGESWGESGYIRLQKDTGGQGLCLIASNGCIINA